MSTDSKYNCPVCGHGLPDEMFAISMETLEDLSRDNAQMHLDMLGVQHQERENNNNILKNAIAKLKLVRQGIYILGALLLLNLILMYYYGSVT